MITCFDFDNCLQNENREPGIRLWARRVALNVNETTSWDIDDPLFCACMPESGSDCLLQGFEKLYHQTVFSEGFLASLKASCNGGTGGVYSLILIARAWLDEFVLFDPYMPEYLKEVTEPCAGVFKGILAARWAMPLAYGSSLQDVLLIMPDKTRTPLTKMVEKMGKIIVQTLREDPVWVEGKNLHKEFSGAEATFGAPCWTLCLALDTMVEDAGIEDLKPLLRNFIESADTWNKHLKPACLDPHEAIIVKQIKNIMRVDGLATVDDIKLFENACKRMLTDSGRALHNSLLQQVKNSLRTLACGKFEGLLEEFHCKPCLEQVEDVLASTRAVAAQAHGWTPSQAKLIQSSAVATLGLIRAISTLPVNESGTVAVGFANLPLLLAAFHGGTLPETQPSVSAVQMILENYLECEDCVQAMLGTEQYEQRVGLVQRNVARVRVHAEGFSSEASGV